MPTGQEIHDEKIKTRQIKRDESSSSTVRKRLTREINNLEQKPDYQRIGIDAKGGTKGKVAVDTGKQAHHLTSLNNASAFFEGLDLNEKAIMGQAFAKHGLIPGDLTMNRLDLFAELHQGGIHAIERALKLEGKVYFKPGASLKERLAAVEAFAADQKLLATIGQRMQFKAEFETGGLTRQVESTATNELAKEFHEKAKRRLKNQGFDWVEYIPEQHEVARALGPQIKVNNDARLSSLEPYWKDSTFDVARLQADAKTGIYKLPKAGKSKPFFETVAGSVKLRKASGLLPVAGAAVGFSIAGSQAMAGDIKGAQVTALETGLSEIPVVGDIFTADPAVGGTLEAASVTQRDIEERRLNPTAADKFFRDPLNELEYAGKQLIGGLKTVGGAILFGF